MLKNKIKSLQKEFHRIHKSSDFDVFVTTVEDGQYCTCQADQKVFRGSKLEYEQFEKQNSQSLLISLAVI